MKRRYLSWNFSYRVDGKRHVGKVFYEKGNAVTALQCKAHLIDRYKEPVSVWPIRTKRS